MSDEDSGNREEDAVRDSLPNNKQLLNSGVTDDSSTLKQYKNLI
jgi:hypothetical protein